MISNTQRRTLCLFLFFVVESGVFAAETNILLIGSSRSFSNEQYSGIARNQSPFNPQLVVDELTNILNGDAALGTINVVFEDIYRSTTRTLSNPVGTFNLKCYSLLHYYYWPDGRTARLNNLKGADGTAWDYVVILGDPSLIASTPGVYAKGVKLIVDKVKEGTAQPMLMMLWPQAGSSVPVSDFGEVTYRVGDSGGIPVAPAGYAWEELTAKDSGTHPTAKGAYLAAATLYSKMFDRNATTSTYSYDDSLADHAHSSVQTHLSQSHYSGLFSTVNPYHSLNDKDRVIKGDKGGGSSTEDGFLNYGAYNNNRYFNNLVRPQIFINSYNDDPDGFSGLTHFHIGRNSTWDDSKRYRVWTDTYRYAFAFPFQVRDQDSVSNDGGLDMLYGIDIMEAAGFRGDQRTAFDLIDRGHVSQGVRVLPVQSIWAAVNDEMGISTPFYTDGNHYGADVNEAVVSYMLTTLTGRCPIGKNGTAAERSRRRIGYETAWMMSTLSIRPPGYTVYPSSADAKTVTPGSSEMMTVYFVNPPQSPVSVNVSVDSSKAAIVNPKVLTFDASNHDTIQNVRITGLPGGAASEIFNVNFQTTSDDIAFSGLPDSWTYTNNRGSPESLTIQEQATRQISVAKNGSKVIDLQVAGSSSSNTIFAMPFHGTLSWAGSDVVYTPDTDFIGSDSFAFAVDIDGVLTKGYIEISVQGLPVTVTYNGNGSDGGSVPVDASSYNTNDTVTVLAPGTLSRSGYTFSHWDTIPNGSGTEYAPSDTFQISAETTLYAQWTTDYTIDYFEDFNNAGQPIDPSGTGWEMYNAVNPAQSTWEDFIPGDGKAYITVTSASHDDDRAYQMFNAGQVGPGQRLEIRAKNMACPGYTAFLFTYTDENWDEIDFDEIDIEIVASDDQGTDPGHPIGTNGGWTDARFNCWSNADGPSYTPWKGVAKPVEDENGQAVSHMDDEWHTYTIEWINDGGLENGPNGRCLFYIDGVLQYTIHNMSPDSMSGVLIGYRDLSWAGPDNPIGWSGEHTMELDWYRVTPIDYHSPTAIFDSYNVETGVNNVTASVLANDNGTGLTAVLISQPEHGILTLNSDGTFTYTADAGFAGRDHFVYYATDGTSKGKSNAAVVELIINDPPTVNAGPDQTIYLIEGAPWTPASIPTVAWFDASDLSTISKDGSNKVSQWNDKSGNNNHATQSSGGAPTYVASDAMVNNLPSIGNPGSSAQIGLLTPSMTAKNVYVVTYFKDGADTTFDAYCTLLSGNGSWGSYRIMGNTGQANFYNTSHFNNGGTYRNGSTTNALSGALPMPATLYKFKSTALRLQPYALGYNQAEVSRDWLGSYCEFIFTDGTEDLATEQKIEGYLAHKWGLTAHLPADHPYKSQAPGGSSAVANLDGTVSDANGNSTSTIWSDTGTGTGNGSITIGNTSAVDTTATFTETGTYILRLTANDGFDTAHDEVTITVIDDPGKPTYTLTVTNGTGGGDYSAGANVAITADAPAAGYRFVNWTTSDGGSFADANTASTTYTMPANSAEVIANYALNNQPVVDAGFDQTVALTEAIPWTPAELSTMAWYDASDANTITIVAGKVSAWADKSQNGHGLSQATESARPVTGTRTINGLNALDFAPGLYLFNDSAAVVSGNPDLMIVSVQVLDQTVTGNDAILILGNGTGGTTAGIMGGTNGYSWRFFDGYEAYGSVNTGSAEIQIGIRAAGSNYTGSEMWLNGVQLSATAGGSTNTPNIASGIWASGKGGYMDGAVGEMIVLQDSSISSRQKVEGYLAHKWGLAGNLPTGHLYKSAAPLTSGQMVTVNLDGTVSDADGDPLTTTWSTISGPASVTIANTSAVDTTATFTQVGVYVLRLSAYDGVDTVYDEVTITITDGSNNAPVIVLDSPSTASVTIPEGPGLFVETTITDDGNPAPGNLSASWSKVSGPEGGTATFGSPSSDDTAVTFSAAGQYVLRLTADDGARQSTLDVTVDVGGTAANVGPFVAASDSMGTTGMKINLQSTVTDDGNPGPATILWMKRSGPGNAAITDASLANASANFDTAGTYSMRVTADDGAIKTFDDATVTVNDPQTSNVAPVANDDNYGASSGFALVVSTPGVLSNDTDLDGDPLTAMKVSDPANGTLVFNADGSFTYTPDAGFNGKDSFTYKCHDGMDESNVATVSIRISGGSRKKR